ncbi:MAG: hypothetical protein WBB45_19930 [Cyclobacteriaceae bacterium]
MKIKTNSLIEGFSGQNGNVVFRTLKNGDIIMSNMPREYATTEHQRKSGERLALAQQKAGEILENDPGRVAEYQKYADRKGYHLRLAIVTDILSKPRIGDVSWAEQPSLAGAGTLQIEASDDHKVTSVAVSVLDSAGDLLEQGEALSPTYGLGHHYAFENNNLAPDTELVITVNDYAGNVTSKTMLLSDILVT